MFHRAVGGRMEPMVHARRQPDRHVAAVPVGFDQRRVVQQVAQRVGKSLRLEQLGAGDRPMGTDNAVAWAHQQLYMSERKQMIQKETERKKRRHRIEIE